MGALWASLLFGFMFALQLRLQTQNLQIAYQFLQILPYVATIVVMLLVRGQSAQPKALGVPTWSAHERASPALMLEEILSASAPSRRTIMSRWRCRRARSCACWGKRRR